MSLCRTVSEINGDFRRKFHSKILNFPTTVYLTPPLKRFSLEVGTDRRKGSKN